MQSFSQCGDYTEGLCWIQLHFAAGIAVQWQDSRPRAVRHPAALLLLASIALLPEPVLSALAQLQVVQRSQHPAGDRHRLAA